ncbi:MAG: UDP-N-acetylmuramate--L-alanine ligase [Prevotellaceae bacterium]|jgi:UDP-N-acetylmuramate--alanine ligase|nr:UDP-N-acetylmuramate--L-alanine ligase [Prevotellaceae bacterium]
MKQTYTHYYFLGIGGIGMSALARYFNAKGGIVAGYDRVRSLLCEELETEGITVHYQDDVALIPASFKDADRTLVVYTPAVPNDHSELLFFRRQGFTVQKRAEALGEITRMQNALCFAGTHGKTTTSTMAAHLLKESHVDCNAFLGGISLNYASNLLLSDQSDLVVIEADEYDRSFHCLQPRMAVITSTDADHLDIYGTHEAYVEAFEQFTTLITGCLISKKNIALTPRLQPQVKHYTYSAIEQADFYADNIRIGNGEIVFDFITPSERIYDIQLGAPVVVNIENGVAAMAVAWLNGVTANELKRGMASFAGIRRRFETHLKTDSVVMIDDYAHHPEELRASIRSVKALYSDKHVLGIFQPHLYSRTRDFYQAFADALSQLDSVILVEIYPAREEPIAGVTSQIIFDEITNPNKTLTTKAELLETLKERAFDVLLTIGAGDIDGYIPQIVDFLKKR